MDFIYELFNKCGEFHFAVQYLFRRAREGCWMRLVCYKRGLFTHSQIIVISLLEKQQQKMTITTVTY